MARRTPYRAARLPACIKKASAAASLSPRARMRFLGQPNTSDGQFRLWANWNASAV